MAKYGLIGKKLGHSLSPEIHNLLGYDYDLVELSEDEVESFVKNGDYAGFNVTIPYKKTVMPYLDYVDPVAEAIGAVNTVVRRNGKTYGYNTDVLGMKYALSHAKVDIKDKKVMILGTGGTSATAKYLAKDLGASEIVVVSRTGDVNYTNYVEHRDTQVIINTTPIGMYPENGEKLVNLDAFPSLSGGFDPIYNPLMTEFIFGLKERGINCDNGLRMLVGQAKFARDLFFNDTIGDEVIEEIYNKIHNRFLNIILVGMPGAGKSVIGKALAKALSKTFVDTDEEIVRREGVSIPEIFERGGEEEFRRIESEVVSLVTKERNRIISFGGGAIINPLNIKSAKQNGIIVYIKRDLDCLARDGRPLSKSPDALRELFVVRKPIYENCADIIVENNSTVDEVTQKIVEEFYENSRN